MLLNRYKVDLNENLYEWLLKLEAEIREVIDPYYRPAIKDCQYLQFERINYKIPDDQFVNIKNIQCFQDILDNNENLKLVSRDVLNKIKSNLSDDNRKRRSDVYITKPNLQKFTEQYNLILNSRNQIKLKKEKKSNISFKKRNLRIIFFKIVNSLVEIIANCFSSIHQNKAAFFDSINNFKINENYAIKDVIRYQLIKGHLNRSNDDCSFANKSERKSLIKLCLVSVFAIDRENEDLSIGNIDGMIDRKLRLLDEDQIVNSIILPMLRNINTKIAPMIDVFRESKVSLDNETTTIPVYAKYSSNCPYKNRNDYKYYLSIEIFNRCKKIFLDENIKTMLEFYKTKPISQSDIAKPISCITLTKQKPNSKKKVKFFNNLYDFLGLCKTVQNQIKAHGGKIDVSKYQLHLTSFLHEETTTFKTIPVTTQKTLDDNKCSFMSTEFDFLSNAFCSHAEALLFAFFNTELNDNKSNDDKLVNLIVNHKLFIEKKFDQGKYQYNNMNILCNGKVSDSDKESFESNWRGYKSYLNDNSLDKPFQFLVNYKNNFQKSYVDIFSLDDNSYDLIISNIVKDLNATTKFQTEKIFQRKRNEKPANLDHEGVALQRSITLLIHLPHIYMNGIVKSILLKLQLETNQSKLCNRIFYTYVQLIFQKQNKLCPKIEEYHEDIIQNLLSGDKIFNEYIDIFFFLQCCYFNAIVFTIIPENVDDNLIICYYPLHPLSTLIDDNNNRLNLKSYFLKYDKDIYSFIKKIRIVGDLKKENILENSKFVDASDGMTRFPIEEFQTEPFVFIDINKTILDRSEKNLDWSDNSYFYPSQLPKEKGNYIILIIIPYIDNKIIRNGTIKFKERNCNKRKRGKTDR